MRPRKEIEERYLKKLSDLDYANWDSEIKKINTELVLDIRDLNKEILKRLQYLK